MSMQAVLGPAPGVPLAPDQMSAAKIDVIAEMRQAVAVP